jgi:uncharacterized protein YndB with AHSA1/START domain
MTTKQIIKPAPVRKTLTVPATPERAFEVFTTGFDRWWPRSHTIGKGPLKEAVLEPRAGGRWYGVDDDGTQTPWGDVLVWEPPARLVLAWRIGADWQYHAELLTEVEVTFTPLTALQTRVDLEHRYLDRMGDAAASTREGLDGPGGWGGILQGYADVVRAS